MRRTSSEGALVDELAPRRQSGRGPREVVYLCDDSELEPALRPASRYLLLAMLEGARATGLRATPAAVRAARARHPSALQTRQLIAAFENEAGARAAFRALRLQRDPRALWAQVVELDGDGALRLLCWFGPAPILADGRDAPWLPGATAAGAAGSTRSARAARR
jgi:hypothetical protein